MPERESKSQGEDWTITYYAENREKFVREHVKFYQVQDALMSLSREAYNHGTWAARIVME